MSSPELSDTPEDWDAASVEYAERVAPVLTDCYADAMLERLAPTADSEALEVAAGSGALTAALQPRVDSLLAVDYSVGMIEILRERAKRCGWNNVQCEVMDGQDLKLDDGSFDRVASQFGLMLFDDREKGLREMRRILRPGGRCVVSGWANLERFEVFALFLDGIKSAYPNLPPPPRPPAALSLADPAALEAQMKTAGFEDVVVDFVTRQVEVESFAQLWGMLTGGAPPVRKLFERLGPAGPERVRAALAEIVEKRFGREPIRLSNTATVGTGFAR